MCDVCGCEHPEPRPPRRVRIELDLLARNNALAAANRRAFQARRLRVLNLMSSPGAGKTALLVQTIRHLDGQWPIAVIEGDPQTQLDADRIRAVGGTALQINTGRGCHLDAAGVGRAAQELDLAEGGLLLLENVGNLVCPAGFDLGEDHRVVILSVPEGDDKPRKYPALFASADLLVINKIDLLPLVAFDLDRCVADARALNPGLEVIRLSAQTGEHLQDWIAWLRLRVPA
jgi:hydrogenase nickel incorporation protein HypB